MLAFCTAAAIPTIFVLPGVCGPGVGREAALERSAASLGPLVAMAGDAGVTLTVEPHVGGFLESPDSLALLDAAGPEADAGLRAFRLPRLHARRDRPARPPCRACPSAPARPGALQCKLEHGTLNFPAMLATLAGHGYRVGSPSSMSTRTTWTRSMTTC
ncbi:MAG: hypothetical protein R3C69_03655 [Geminicoccaceae bacterium]